MNISNRSSKEREFYRDFVSSQFFLQFIEDDCKEKYPYFHKLLLRYNKKPISKKTSITDSIKSLFKRSASTSAFNKQKENLNKSVDRFRKSEVPNDNQVTSNISIMNSTNRNTCNESHSNNNSAFKSAGESKEFSDGHLILPYFVEEDLIKSDYNKLDIHLKERFKGKKGNNYYLLFMIYDL